MSSSKPKSKRQMFKVIMIGESQVGKTKLLDRFVFEKYEEKYKATIGADFGGKEIAVGECNVTIQLWDTAGQERFQSLGVAFYRGADAVLFVYDVARQATFDTADKWLDEFFMHAAPGNKDTFPVFLVGAKCDQEDRMVSAEAAQAFADSRRSASVAVLETCAKEGNSVTELFDEVARRLLEQSADAAASGKAGRPAAAPGLPEAKKGFFSRMFSRSSKN